MKCRYVGLSPTVLASGRPVAPGEVVDTPMDDPFDEQLLADGLLLEIPEDLDDAAPQGDGETTDPAAESGDKAPASRRRNSKKENG